MAVPPSATFQYVTEVPDGATRTSPWQMKSAESFRPTGDSLLDHRLVGWEPLLHISDAGVTPNPSSSQHAVPRSELRLVATDKEYASQDSVSWLLREGHRPRYHTSRSVEGQRTESLYCARGHVLPDQIRF
jgi:hypothetical protein